MGKRAKIAKDKSDIVAELPLACSDEDAAVEFMERQRWGDSPACVHCGDTNVYQMRDRKTGGRNKRYLWRCRGCGKQYTVRVGTVMEDSQIPLRHWCYAFWAACSSKKGVSALQIKRQTGLSYKSALFLMHRIRWAMAPVEYDRKLNGTVEVDETYVGGKPRKRSPGWPMRPSKKGRRTGRGTPKQPVVALVERDGDVRTQVVTNVTAENLKGAIREHVDRDARIVTDEFASYRGIGDEYAGGHEAVRHSVGEYARGDVHTNTAESFFALFKRGMYGTFHNVSRKHLHRYLSEFEFRFNNRHLEDGARTVKAIRSAEGKRLYYRWPTQASA